MRLELSANELEGVVADVRRLMHGPEAGTPIFGRIQSYDGSFFWHPSESADGEPLELYDRVAFVPSTEGRGPRAKSVRLLERYPGPSRTFADETRHCVRCACAFTWSAGEQENFEALGLRFSPSTCQACRVARRTHSRSTHG